MVTLLLLIANLLTYGLELAGGDTEAYCLAHGFDPSQPSLTAALYSLFLHASITHLAGNLLYLAIVGPIVERQLGATRFALLYLLAGCCGLALHALVSTTTLVGASPAVFGLLAAACAVRPRFAPCVLVLGAVNVWQVATDTGGTVGVASHVGGLAAGVVFMLALNPTRRLSCA